MAKKNNKHSNKSSSSSNKNKKNINSIKNEEAIKKQQEQIKQNVFKIIEQLNKDYKKIIFNFKQKKYIKHLILEFENLLNLGEYDVLVSKMKSLQHMYDEEKEISSAIIVKKTKEVKPKFNLLEFLKKARYPIFTRYKKIICEETGATRIKKLCIVSSIILLLIAVSIIGFLMYFNVIKLGSSLTSTDTDNIFSIFVFAIPLGLLFVI